MSFKKDQHLYESVENNLRSSIPFISKNVHKTLNEWSFGEKLGLFAKEMHNKVLDAAHNLNLVANTSAKKNAQRIRDELLTAHYSRELGTSVKNIKNMLASPPGSEERVRIERKIKTIGRANPTISALQKSSGEAIKRYTKNIDTSYAALMSKRSP